MSSEPLVEQAGTLSFTEGSEFATLFPSPQQELCYEKALTRGNPYFDERLYVTPLEARCQADYGLKNRCSRLTLC